MTLTRTVATPAEMRDLITALRSDGATFEVIAKSLNISTATVHNYLNRKDLPKIQFLRGEGFKTNEAAIRELHSYGFTDLEISRKLGIAQTCAVRWRKNCGLLSIVKESTVVMVDAEHIRCISCGEISKAHCQRLDGTPSQSRCGSCAKKNMKANRTDFGFMKTRFFGLRKRCSEDGTIIEISPEYLLNLWNRQEGKCFYTDEPMALYSDSGIVRNLFSVDKIIPEKGYTPGNVVLCTFRANELKRDMSLFEMKNYTPDWYRRVAEYKKLNSKNKTVSIKELSVSQLAISFSGDQS